jgi:hypothetical protein
MHKINTGLLCVAVISAALTLSVEAATDAARIQMLEAQLRQQRQILEAMDAELKQLKAGQSSVIGEVRIIAVEEDRAVVADLDVSEGQDKSEFAKGQIAQINLLHYPRDNGFWGTEYSSPSRSTLIQGIL